MNNAVTSREEIVRVSRKMILEKGMASVSMRNVAAQCGIALGSVYNYFPSKADLLSATIESVWDEIFTPLTKTAQFENFISCVSCMYETIQKGNEQYPGFFTIHSLNFASGEKAKGKAIMERYFDSLKKKLIQALEQDKHIRPDAFGNGLTKEVFADYVFTLLLSTLLRKQANCHSLPEMIKKCIY